VSDAVQLAVQHAERAEAAYARLTADHGSVRAAETDMVLERGMAEMWAAVAALNQREQMLIDAREMDATAAERVSASVAQGIQDAQPENRSPVVCPLEGEAECGQECEHPGLCGRDCEHPGLTHTVDTIHKVYRALRRAGVSLFDARDAISNMQNDGILFRERASRNPYPGVS
jgi:hypothetical protein